MDWINLHIPSVIRSPEYVGSSPAERGTWLSVMAYACGLECGGRIGGAALWKDRQWQQACGVTLREVRAADRLLAIEGDDVLVNGYPVAAEKQVIEGRKFAKAGAMARWGKKHALPHAGGHALGHMGNDALPHALTMPLDHAKGEGEGEGEGKRGSASPRASPKPRPRLTARDLLLAHRGHLDYFRSGEGPAEAEAKLAAAIELYGAKHVDRAITGRFTATRQPVHIDAVLDACRALQDRQALDGVSAAAPSFPGLLGIGQPKASP